ncbi:MAG: hypothetical protein JST36_00690 [Bacteroidetes bacterium]|nr:hypothetical protein [Bacteroidota bacterium]
MKLLKYCVALFLLMNNMGVHAQQSNQQGQPQIMMPKPPRRVGNPALRYEVDAKRTGTNMNSDDALPRSREFIRIDSSYYVGWMYEGAYKYNHAADYVGFKNAEEPLLRALRQMERDYRPELATRTHNVFEYMNIYPKQIDYAIIVNYLNQCYLNTEQPDKAYTLLRKYVKWNFQREFFDAYNYLMWVTHRNRFYTSAKYSFLKNSIADNEALANRYLDTAIFRLKRNAQFNVGVYNPGYDKNDYLGVYHYKSMLFAYALKIDSAEKYFNKLKESPIFPHNNYATFKTVCGDFKTAEAEYKLAQLQDAGDKRLQEYVYYSSILDIYKGLPKSGEQRMKDEIQANGSTPGFGWYNIALARCLLYDGQINESIRYGDRAAGFKELHIGTTLGQSHYDFSIQLNKLMTKEAQYEMQRFENKGWWYAPNVMVNMVKLATERYLQAFLIINQFAQNPERDQVIYRLFSTESTISWDEVYDLISNFSSRFFIRKFSESAQNDPRPKIRKYFSLLVARLQAQEGDYQQAYNGIKALLASPDLDPTYEKLFLARAYQTLAQCADGLNKTTERDAWLYQLYKEYPQLVPFCGMKMKMNLQVVGAPDDAVVARLQACNINFDAGNGAKIRARLRFFTKGGIKMVAYATLDEGGNYVVPEQSWSYSKTTDAGVALAYRLFDVGGQAKEKPE